MALNLDPQCKAAVDLAKRALVSSRTALDTESLLAALYHGAGLQRQYPQLVPYLVEPKPIRAIGAGEQVPLDDALKPILQRLADEADNQPVGAERMFRALLESDAGRAALRARGVPDRDIADVLKSRVPPSGWRASRARDEAVKALSSFGRMLTLTEPPSHGIAEMDTPLKSLTRTLSRMRRRNAIVIGFPGTGKSALVYEFARRLVRGHESIPERLSDLDVFELSPVFLRSGASMVGQYEERVKGLIQVLKAHPKIVLFVDEIHSMFQSGIHERGPFTEANEAFKSVLGKGEIICIGCTTPAEYRHHIEPDAALARRFTVIRLEPPSRETTIRILETRRPRLEEYFAPLRIPDAMLRRAVELTDDYLTGRQQPDKSIQLLDEACAACVTADVAPPEVTEEALVQALQDMVGHGILGTRRLTEAEVYNQLSAKLIGQDDVLQAVARAFVAGLGGWRRPTGPRGVFLFGGPTGVGKTEAAVMLATILSGTRESLVRVDCSTLQGSGYDSRPSVNRLLGVPPGYIGYSRGQGGLLSRIRDLPESIVLFDEFEKADPGVGQLLLRILDEGRVEDVDGNLLDFRRSFMIFTSNAGASYEQRAPLGFSTESRHVSHTPVVAVEPLLAALRARGLGEEFLGRIDHVFLFQGLGTDSIARVVELQLEGLRGAARERGLDLDWEPALIPHLTSRWQPRFGVRALSTILQNRVNEQLSIAEAQGEMEHVTGIHLQVAELEGVADAAMASGLALRERHGSRLIIALA